MGMHIYYGLLAHLWCIIPVLYCLSAWVVVSTNMSDIVKQVLGVRLIELFPWSLASMLHKHLHVASLSPVTACDCNTDLKSCTANTVSSGLECELNAKTVPQQVDSAAWIQLLTVDIVAP